MKRARGVAIAGSAEDGIRLEYVDASGVCHSVEFSPSSWLYIISKVAHLLIRANKDK